MQVHIHAHTQKHEQLVCSQSRGSFLTFLGFIQHGRCGGHASSVSHTHTCADLKVACCSSGVNVIGKKKRSTFFESAIVLSPFSPSPASGLLVYQTLERERAPRHLKRPQRVLDPSARPATAPTLTDYQECVLMIVTMFRMYICSVFF